jgi:hypothetical protein
VFEKQLHLILFSEPDIKVATEQQISEFFEEIMADEQDLLIQF